MDFEDWEAVTPPTDSDLGADQQVENICAAPELPEKMTEEALQNEEKAKIEYVEKADEDKALWQALMVGPITFMDNIPVEPVNRPEKEKKSSERKETKKADDGRLRHG